MSTSWVIPSPTQKYGMGMVGQKASAVASPLAGSAGPSVSTQSENWLHPDNGLFWFAAVAAAAVGLMGASTHIRVGPARVGADLGKD